MAAPITTKSLTLEGQLQEIIDALTAKQINPATNPDNITIIGTYNVNALTGFLNASFVLPVDSDIDPADGSVDYLARAVYL